MMGNGVNAEQLRAELIILVQKVVRVRNHIKEKQLETVLKMKQSAKSQ